MRPGNCSKRGGWNKRETGANQGLRTAFRGYSRFRDGYFWSCRKKTADTDDG